MGLAALSQRDTTEARRHAGEVLAGRGLAIDRDHLAQMTLGDPGLAREVLELFDRQSDILVDRMRGGPASAVPPLAHTLKGSARGIGAWEVARCAELVELADGTRAEFDAALAQLASAVSAARASIRDIIEENQAPR